MSSHLDLRDVSVSFNGFKALNALNMSVRKGELRCLIGPNGAGKSVLLRLLHGLLPPTGGAVRWAGEGRGGA